MPENANAIQTSTNLVKMAGYLEKRGKMGMMGTRWRRWWCVLEGRLLLYYKSQSECSNLSPCRGSLNMGLAASVTPARNFQLHVATRSQLCVLKARNQAEQERWLQALLDSMTSQPLPAASLSWCHSTPSMHNGKSVHHFRYSNTKDKNNSSRETSSRTESSDSSDPSNDLTTNTHLPNGKVDFVEGIKNKRANRISYQEQPEKSILNKYDRNSQHFVRGVIELDENFNLNNMREKERNETFDPGFIDWNNRNKVTSFGNETSQSDALNSTENSSSAQKMAKDRSDSSPVDLENKQKSSHYSSVPEESIPIENLDREKTKPKISAYKEKKVSLQDCRLKIKSDTNLYADPMGSVERLFTGIGKDTRITRRKSNEIKENILKMRSISDACLLKSIYDDTNILSCENKLKKSSSKTELVPINADSSGKSKSCENVYVSFKLADSNESSDSSLENPQKSLHSKTRTRKNSVRRAPRRTDSFLKRFIISPKSVEKADSMKKRLSFFQRFVARRKNKDGSKICDKGGATISRYQQSAESDESFNSSPVERQIFPDYSSFNSRFIIVPPSPGPEPRPDYDEYSSDGDSDELDCYVPELPPRQLNRPHSPWHDVPKNNQPVPSALPPPLPLKLKRNSQIGNPNYINFALPTRKSKSDSPTDDLTKLNSDYDDIISTNKNNFSGESIYDIPRPHATLSLTLQEAKLNCDNDAFSSGFREQMIGEPDSLDVSTKQIFFNETESCITPDSLELNWCLKADATHYLHETWISDSFEKNLYYLGGEHYQDSLDFNGQSQHHLLQY